MTIDEVLTRAVDKILPSKEALKKLMAKKSIRLYLGVDPTATKLHLGHTVMIRKLQQFADLGHEAIFLFGTGTTLVGDPSERDTGRKLINYRTVKKNMATWKKQISPILDLKKVKFMENGDWLTKLTLQDMIKIGSHITAVQLFKRDSFQRRLKQGDTIWYHETMYPLLQGYDSVVMDVDLEIGGTDQTFNMLIGRELQQKINHREKFVLTGQMIMGTDGKKMSKTSNNCIWLTDKPNDMFGKLMKVQDQLIPQYFEFFTNKPMAEINQLTKDIKSGQADPLTAKKQLALDITSQFHGSTQAQAAQKHFQQVSQDRGVPQKIPSFTLPHQSLTALAAVTSAKLGKSNSDRKRVIQQGGFEVDGQKITDPNQTIDFSGGKVIKFGKRQFAKLTPSS